MADESILRRSKWLQYGCNAFNVKNPESKPMSFWTEQDVLKYIKFNNIEIAKPYGKIVAIDTKGFEYPDIICNNLKLKTTGCKRTGCVFCMFGCHLEKNPNRFEQLRITHPNLYNYCMNGGEYIDGKWVPSKDGLGLSHVLNYIGVKY